MEMSQKLADNELNQIDMNMSEYSTNTWFDHTEMNYSETDDYYDNYQDPEPWVTFVENHPAHLIPLLFVSCLGLITNIISAMVWFSKVKSKTGAFFLGCLSGVDACFCLSMAMWKYMEIVDISGKLFKVIVTIVRPLAYTSRLLTLPVVAHRWISISRPLTMTREFALHRQVKVQACLILSILPIYGCFIYTNIVFNSLDMDLDWYFVWSYYFVIILYAWSALITICLLVLNTLLLTAACRMRKIVPSDVTGNWQNTVEHRMTVIVLFMSTFSLLDNITYMIISFDLINYAKKDGIIIGGILFIICHWSLLLNSSIHFVFYMCFAKDFRFTLLSMCKSVAIRITGDHTHGQEH